MGIFQSIEEANNTSERLLRSEIKNSHGEFEKFDFDTEEYEINPKRKLRLVSRINPNAGHLRKSKSCFTVDEHVDETRCQKPVMKSPFMSKVDDEIKKKRETITKMTLEIEHHELSQNIRKPTDDLLPDSTYQPYHKKMLKQENRMIQSDIVNGENEADRLSLISDRLGMLNWEVTLQKVTKINDPTDENEMETKRYQTKELIDSMLHKFESMKKKSRNLARRPASSDSLLKLVSGKDWPKIYTRIDRTFIPDYASSSDEEEEKITVEEIRERRLKKREQQCGGSIIVLLSDHQSQKGMTRFAIVAEPLRKPYLIKTSTKERNSWKNKVPTNPKKFKKAPRISTQIAVKRRREVIPLTMEVEAEVIRDIRQDTQKSMKLNVKAEEISVTETVKSKEMNALRNNAASISPTLSEKAPLGSISSCTASQISQRSSENVGAIINNINPNLAIVPSCNEKTFVKTHNGMKTNSGINILPVRKKKKV